MGRSLGRCVTALCLGTAMMVVGGWANAKDKADSQDGKGCPNGGPQWGDSWGGHGRGEGFGRIGWMADWLDLTEDQIAKIKDISKKSQEETKPVRERTDKDLKALGELRKKGAEDGELQPQLDKVYADQEEMAANHQKAMVAMRSVLTPKQQAKFALGMRQHKRHFGKGGFWKKDGKGRGDWKGKKGDAPVTETTTDKE